MLNLSETRKRQLLLVLILIVSAFLRLYKLDFQSLGNDELSSWNLSSRAESVSEVITTQAEHDVNPPGYQVLLFYVIKYFGDTDIWLRLPSALAGILSVYMIYLLGVKLFSAKEGLIAAALTGVTWCPVYFSQEARVYSFLLLFSIVSMFFWIDLITESASLKSKPYFIVSAYVISAVITISLHYFGLLLIALQFSGMLFYFLIKKKHLKYFLIAYGIIFILFIPFIRPLLIDFNPSFKIYIDSPTPFSFIKVLLFFFNNSSWFLELGGALYLFLILKIIYDKSRNGKNRSDFNLVILFLWLLIPFLVSYIISVLFLPVLTERNLIISLPAVLLIFSHALIRLPLGLLIKKSFIVSVICLFLFHLVVKTKYYETYEKPEFKGAVKYIIEKEDKTAEPLIIGYCWSEYMFNYYFKKMGSDFQIDVILGGKNDIDSLKNLIEDWEPENFWYVFAHREPDKEFLDFLNKTYSLKEAKKFQGAGVFHYQIY
ncbi:MAG TPA: glycosyltransferase family 39 protein [Ignavibacteriaceae bacterium]|nr:glycosyltransferase family 39 protein [Ignavibacteriaceae bacterium]